MTIHCDHSRILLSFYCFKASRFFANAADALAAADGKFPRKLPARHHLNICQHSSRFHLYFAEAGYISQHSNAVGAYQGRSQPLSLATHLPPLPIVLLSNFCLLVAASTIASSVQQLCESIVTCLIVFSFAVCGYYAQAAPPTPSLSLTPPPPHPHPPRLQRRIREFLHARSLVLSRQPQSTSASAQFLQRQV